MQLLKTAQQHLFFLHKLRELLHHVKRWIKGMLNMLNTFNKQILLNFYQCTLESLLTSTIIIWFKNLSLKENKASNRVVCSALSFQLWKTLINPDVFLGAYTLWLTWASTLLLNYLMFLCWGNNADQLNALHLVMLTVSSHKLQWVWTMHFKAPTVKHALYGRKLSYTGYLYHYYCFNFISGSVKKFSLKCWPVHSSLHLLSNVVLWLQMEINSILNFECWLLAMYSELKPELSSVVFFLLLSVFSGVQRMRYSVGQVFKSMFKVDLKELFLIWTIIL